MLPMGLPLNNPFPSSMQPMGFQFLNRRCLTTTPLSSSPLSSSCLILAALISSNSFRPFNSIRTFLKGSFL
ncbi:hypothetical protein YQE_03209, partial [Dendroctonus ponderosae]